MNILTFRSSGAASRVSRFAPVATAAALAFTLSACIVVPLDPHTGQPYGSFPRDTSAYGGQATVAPAPLPIAGSIQSAPSLLTVRLYPLNTQANRAGLISAQVLDNNAGHGTFTVPYLGDTLQGESARVDASYAAFGHIHQQVLGAAQRSFVGRRGIANAYGAHGVNAQCEYVLTAPGAGTGVCAFSDGSNFQMYFGG